MSLSSASVKRPVTTIVLVAMVLLLGWVALGRLAIDLLPKITYPGAAVMTTYSGAGPQEIEQMVTRPLESILGTVNNVKKITSYSMADSSIVVVEFEWGTDMDFAALAMREKVDLVKRYFPSDVEAPMVVKFDPSMLPIMNLGVSGNRSLASLKKLVNDEIKSRLERIDGVAAVSVTGGLDREVRVSLDPNRLKQYGLSASQISQALRLENMNLPGGRVTENKRELTIRTIGEFSKVDEIGNILISSPGGPSVRLRELGKVVDTVAEQRNMSRVDGRPSVGLYIQKQASANTVLVSRKVKRELAALQRSLPKDVKVTTAMDQSDFIERSINNVRDNAYMGSLLAVLVLFAFLWHWAPTLIIGLSIPFSIIVTFVLMYFSKLTINLMSLGGLALGVGMMVDNSIVVLENIYRYRQEGHSLLEAATLGADEVGMAIQASTYTNLVVFVPILFVQGIAGQIFKEMALTVTYSLMASLVVAMTLVPVLSSRLMRNVKVRFAANEEEAARVMAGKLGEWYYHLLDWALRHRRLVIGASVFAFVTSFIPWALVDKEFMPQMDARELSVSISMPKGSTLAETDRVARRMEAVVVNLPETDTVFTNVGGGNAYSLSTESGTENASLTVRLRKGKAAKGGRSTADIVDLIRGEAKRLPGATIKVSQSGGMMSMGGGAPVEVKIKGDNLTVLAGLADQVVQRISKIEGIREASSSLSEGRPEIRIALKRDKAAQYGLSTSVVASAVRTAIGGEVATRYRVGGNEVDVRVQYDEASRKSPQDLSNVTINTPTGLAIPLSEVADIEPGMGPNVINRENQSRLVSVTAQIHNRFSGAVIRDVMASLKDFRLPEGYTLVYGGDQQQMQESFGQLGQAFLLAAVLVYIIMAAQFESFLHPFTIMFTMPMAFIGVAWTLFLTGKPLSLYAIIGCIMLAGIVVNNAIVLVDYTNTLRSRGYSRNDAVRRAGPTRLRPVLMTTLTTILGLVPLGLGIGEGAEAEAPMALTIIGGLTMSTVLTLVVVPVIYTLFDDLGARFSRKKAEPDQAGPAAAATPAPAGSQGA
ncbi:MAG: efflux RND transporter permease subunit [Chitinophagales bacterium]